MLFAHFSIKVAFCGVYEFLFIIDLLSWSFILVVEYNILKASSWKYLTGLSFKKETLTVHEFRDAKSP